MKLLSIPEKLFKALMAHSYYLIGIVHRYIGNSRGVRWEYEAAIDAFTRALNGSPISRKSTWSRHLYWREIDHPRKASRPDHAMNLDPRLLRRSSTAPSRTTTARIRRAIGDFQVPGRRRTSLLAGNAKSMIRELSEWVPNAEVDR